MTQKVVEKLKTLTISIHTLLAESDPPESSALLLLTVISIHTLLAESDNIGRDAGRGSLRISIHTLLAESDSVKSPRSACHGISIHTLLAESDGLREASGDAPSEYFNPHSPCGE